MIATEIRKKIVEKKMTCKEVAVRCEWSQSNFSNRLKTDDMKESDMLKVADALGCELIITLVDKEKRRK